MTEEAKNLCAIVTPFGNYCYTRLPMGVKQSPDIAQAHIESLLSDCEECNVYIDDVGIFSNDWDTHMQCLRKILQKLQDHGFMCTCPLSVRIQSIDDRSHDLLHFTILSCLRLD